jgi:TRAP-type uncharacterized transport system substrate-binding protein
MTSAMDLAGPTRGLLVAWWSKGLIRILLLLIIAAVVAAIVGAFGIARDYGYLRASVLTGSAGGYYHDLATRLADRAKREHGSLDVIPTAGSIENVNRLAATCAENFALIQDGTPVPRDGGLELLGRLPEPESLLFLGRRGQVFPTFADLHGVSIGIGPEGSGTAYLMHQLFKDPDLRGLDVRMSNHDVQEQAQLVAEGKLDIAAMVMQENAELLHTIINQNGLDIVSPHDLVGLVGRFPWLSVGVIPAGRYDLVRRIPAVDKQVVHLGTLVVAGRCAQRADRVALLMLLADEIPGFVRGNPPNSTSPATILPLAPSARQFFLSGQPELADRYFPWLVNILSPVYWVYLFMAVTILFKGSDTFHRFRLWRIDAAREKLELALKELIQAGLTHAQMRAVEVERAMATPEKRAAAQAIMDQLVQLRARCERHSRSFFTPMGAEMFYRYQQSLIDEATTTVGGLLQKPSSFWKQSVVVTSEASFPSSPQKTE